MTALTSDSLKKILGDIDGNTLAAIQATGASLKDVTDAKAIVDGESDIVGQGEQEIAGPVKQVVMILSGVSE
ncbi:MAG: hypothetical protein ACX93P_11185 [Roseovarius sp.]